MILVVSCAFVVVQPDSASNGPYYGTVEAIVSTARPYHCVVITVRPFCRTVRRRIPYYGRSTLLQTVSAAVYQ
jgi:hypothetical protein